MFFTREEALLPPDLSPPDGLTLEQYEAASRVPQILIGAIVPAAISTGFAFARFYTRAAITKNWGYDDTCILLAWGGSVGLVALYGLYTRYGTGYHSIDTDGASDADMMHKLFFASQLLYQAVLSLTKLGLCVFYLRLYLSTCATRLTHFTMAFIVTFTIAVELGAIFRCTPILGSLLVSQCLDARIFLAVSYGCNIIADLLLMCGALPPITKLALDKREKMYLGFLLSLGLVLIMTATMRFVESVKEEYSIDPRWTEFNVTTWSSIEVSIGIICVSVPAVRPLLRRFSCISTGKSSRHIHSFSWVSPDWDKGVKRRSWWGAAIQAPPDCDEIELRAAGQAGYSGGNHSIRAKPSTSSINSRYGIIETTDSRLTSPTPPTYESHISSPGPYMGSIPWAAEQPKEAASPPNTISEISHSPGPYIGAIPWRQPAGGPLRDETVSPPTDNRQRVSSPRSFLNTDTPSTDGSGSLSSNAHELSNPRSTSDGRSLHNANGSRSSNHTYDMLHSESPYMGSIPWPRNFNQSRNSSRHNRASTTTRESLPVSPMLDSDDPVSRFDSFTPLSEPDDHVSPISPI